MTKEVLIHIKTQQILEDASEQNSDVIELMVAGEYYFRNGSHFLVYDEMMEGFTEPAKNLVKIRPDFMEVRKKGILHVTMLFEKGKTNACLYKTPFGTIQMDVTARKVSVNETSKCMEICADYELGMDGRKIADCVMEMRVTEKSAKEETTFFRFAE